MKKVIVFAFLFTISFLMFLHWSYASCRISFPASVSISKNEYLRVATSAEMCWNCNCTSGDIDVLFNGANEPVTFTRNIYLNAKSTPKYFVEIRPKSGQWDSSEQVEIPFKALCNDKESGYIKVIFLEKEEINSSNITPVIENIKVSEPSDEDKNVDRSLYNAELRLKVTPVCNNCLYMLFVKTKDSEDIYYMMIQKDTNNEELLERFVINRGTGTTSWNCGAYKELTNKQICDGIYFKVKVIDGFGNVSKLSNPYSFYPSDEFMSKYCANQNDGGVGADTKNNSDIANDSGGCSILDLR